MLRSARVTFNDISGIVSQFGLPTINMNCGGIVCTIEINNAINNYGYYQIKNANLNFMAMSLILKTFKILLLSLRIYNSACGNINSCKFNTIATDIKYFIYDTLLLVAKILFHTSTTTYCEFGRQVCTPICTNIFDNGVSEINSGGIGTILCTINCTCIDNYNEIQNGQVSTNFDNIMDNNKYYQSNLALIGGGCIC